MIQVEFLEEIINQQKEATEKKDAGMLREQLNMLPETSSHVLIISGIRRCGKSTLLFQLLRERHPEAVYLNFDDPRLYDFGTEDFIKLDALIKASGSNVLMFDEIQLVNNWERYIRQKLDENYQVYVTGSNASLLGREVGSSLTGRHITKELFPFSYSEYCRFQQLQPGAESTVQYIGEGGFPEYLKQKDGDILTTLLNDIITRDIVVRYNIRDVRTLQRLTVYLLSNIGNRITGNNLKSVFGISSATTMLEYFSHLSETYLLSFVPMFDYSLKKQNINPKKVYAVDTGLVEMVTPHFKVDLGHKLENLVYLALRRRYAGIYYFSGKGECDFLVMDNGAITMAVQVCAQLNTDNLHRETSGLFEALKAFNLKEGLIVTISQSDIFTNNELQAKVVPFHRFATEMI